jgi:hypothetical protein
VVGQQLGQAGVFRRGVAAAQHFQRQAGAGDRGIDVGFGIGFGAGRQVPADLERDLGFDAQYVGPCATTVFSGEGSALFQAAMPSWRSCCSNCAVRCCTAKAWPSVCGRQPAGRRGPAMPDSRAAIR